jgi:hypothetical protein
MPVFLSQTTVPDDEVLLSRLLDTGEPVAQNNSHSSEYEAGSSFDEALAAVADSFKEDNADALEAATIRTEVDEDLSRNLNESSRRSDGALGPISGSSKEDNLRRCLEIIFRKSISLFGHFFSRIQSFARDVDRRYSGNAVVFIVYPSPRAI